MKAIGYIRVSTAGQAEEGVSLDAQAERIRQWAAASGHELVSIHRDEGLSGKRADNRPGLQAAIAEACEHKGVLVVYALSRASRSIADAVNLMESLHKAGADIVSVTEPVDTTNAMGRAFFNIVMTFAQLERDIIAERTTAALAHKKAAGQRVGHVPYGMRVAEDGRTLLPDTAEQDAIRMMRRWRNRGWSLRRIQSELDKRGITSRTGGKWRLNTLADLTGKETSR